MLNKCHINSLAVTNQVGHFWKTAVVFGQVPVFQMLATKFEQNHTYV